MMEEAQYMALVDALEAASGKVSRLGAGIIAAAALDIAKDSRSFSRILGVAHALVLREVIVLETNGGYITVRQRDARTQRTYYQLNAAGERLVEEVSL
nr:hypothetical protein [Brucella pituitosa]